MPITKQGEALAAHLENKEWDKARQLIQRIVNVQTLFKSGWLVVWNVEDVPSNLVYSLLMKIKVLSIQYQNKTFPIGLYSWMHQEFKIHELWNHASVGTCKAFLQALSGTYGGGMTFPKQDQLYDQLNLLWREYLGLPTSYGGARIKPNEEHRDAVMSVSSLDDLERFPQLKSLWLKTKLLLKVLLEHDLDAPDEDNDWLVLHAIAQVDCLSVVTWFALKLHPEQLLMRDKNGNIPLHIAVTKPVYAQQYHAGLQERRYHHFRQGYPEEYKEAQEFMATFLVKACPEAATYMDSNHHVPLMVYLLTLATQQRQNYRNQFYVHSQVQYQHRLERLMEAAPEALVSRDFETKLYPFQTAASVNAPLDFIYTLFRGDPSALKYRKITQREADYERMLQENARLKKEVNGKNALIQQLKLKLAEYECEDDGNTRNKRLRTGR